jgi:hypothetical protein
MASHITTPASSRTYPEPILSGGAVTVSSSGAVVTASSAIFNPTYRGMCIVAANQVRTIVSVVSTTQVMLAKDPTTAFSGDTFTIVLPKEYIDLSVSNTGESDITVATTEDEPATIPAGVTINQRNFNGVLFVDPVSSSIAVSYNDK